MNSPAKSSVQDGHCCVHARLAEACGETNDLWWVARFEQVIVDDLLHRLDTQGLPFLERFGTRERILDEWRGRSANQHAASSSPRIVCAIILAARGDLRGADALLSAQEREARETHPHHADHVQTQRAKLGLSEQSRRED